LGTKKFESLKVIPVNSLRTERSEITINQRGSKWSLNYTKISNEKVLDIFNLNYNEEKSNLTKENLKYKNISSDYNSVKVEFGTCFKPSKITCRQ